MILIVTGIVMFLVAVVLGSEGFHEFEGMSKNRILIKKICIVCFLALSFAWLPVLFNGLTGEYYEFRLFVISIAGLAFSSYCVSRIKPSDKQRYGSANSDYQLYIDGHIPLEEFESSLKNNSLAFVPEKSTNTELAVYDKTKHHSVLLPKVFSRF